MSDHEELSLSQRGDRYTLRRKNAAGKVTRIALTDMNLLALLPLIQRACTQRLEEWTGPVLRAAGASPIIPMTAKGLLIRHLPQPIPIWYKS